MNAEARCRVAICGAVQRDDRLCAALAGPLELLPVEHADGVLSAVEVCGYIGVAAADATAAFIAALRRGETLLPIDLAGPLRDECRRDSFVARALSYRQWRQLQRVDITQQSLQVFFARHKYLVMSHDVTAYRRIGSLLATVAPAQLPAVAVQTAAQIMAALVRPATRGGYANALLHIRGYLKRRLNAMEKAELGAVIEQYRRGRVALAVPLTLLRRHFHRYPNAYIEQQLLMQLCPASAPAHAHG